jgi:SagB-type dehydrogenase family enzyme
MGNRVDRLLTVTPLLRLERSSGAGASAGGWLLHAGQGSQRGSVEVQGPALASWLLHRRFDEAMSVAELEASLGEVLDDAESARELVLMLIDAGVFLETDHASRLRTKGRHWEENGWREAFDMHYAGVGLAFYWTPDVEEYSRNVAGLFRDSERRSVGPQPGPYKESDGGPAIPLAGYLADFPRATAVSMAEVLRRDLPVDRFDDSWIEMSDLAPIVKHAFGVQRTEHTQWGEVLLKTYPSGGARHPLELYLAARRVSGIEQGVYHYDIGRDELRMVADRDELHLVERLAPPHAAIGSAAALLVITCRWLRSFWKYRYSRNYRMILLEVGHMLETVRLAAAATGMRAHCVPAVDEGLAVELLRLRDDLVEGSLHVIGVGRVAGN